jgi:hypothetical protein
MSGVAKVQIAASLGGAITAPRHKAAAMQVGLELCTINEGAAPGSVFEISFMVYDDSMPAHFALQNRTIVVVSACAPGERLCAGLCTSLDCDILARLLQPLPDPEFNLPETLKTPGGVSAPCVGPSRVTSQLAICDTEWAVGRGVCIGVTGMDASTAIPMTSAVISSVEPISCGNWSASVDPVSLALRMNKWPNGCPPCTAMRLRTGTCPPAVYNTTFSYALRTLDAPPLQSVLVNVSDAASLEFDHPIRVDIDLGVLPDNVDSLDPLRRGVSRFLKSEWTQRGRATLVRDLEGLIIPTSRWNQSSARLGGSFKQALAVRGVFLTFLDQPSWPVVRSSSVVVATVTLSVHGSLESADPAVLDLREPDDRSLTSDIVEAVLAKHARARNGEETYASWANLGITTTARTQELFMPVVQRVDSVGTVVFAGNGWSCPRWEATQLLALDVDAFSDQVVAQTALLAATLNSTMQQLSIFSGVNDFLQMQFVGTSWCDFVQMVADLISSVGVSTVKVVYSDLLQPVQPNDRNGIVRQTLQLLSGRASDLCVSSLNTLDRVWATLDNSWTVGTTSALAGDAAEQPMRIADLGTQVVWEVDIGRAAQVLPSRSLRDARGRGSSNSFDNAREVLPSVLGCVLHGKQESCFSSQTIGGTTILGGVLVHQTRSSRIDCRGHFSPALALPCQTAPTPFSIPLSLNLTACEHARRSVSLPGIGSEPVMNARSALFNPEPQVRDYYNLSAIHKEVDCRGEPLAFQGRHVGLYTAGYTVVFPTCASEDAVSLRLRYLQDARCVATDCCVDILYTMTSA